jgi:sugar diacid utilization regulator
MAQRVSLVSALTERSPGGGDPAREPLSAHRSLLGLSMQLTQQDDPGRIVQLVANAGDSLGPCRAEGIFLDGEWQIVRFRGQPPSAADLAGALRSDDGAPVRLSDVPWAWAYPMPMPHGQSGCLVVSAAEQPTENDRFLLQVLAQQAGVALANARLHVRERAQAAELLAANRALHRSVEIHDRLTRVALADEGQEGIARAVYELTDHPTSIEDCFGNLRAWAGPDRPQPYPKDSPDSRDRLLRRVMDAVGPVRDGDRLVSVARLAGVPVGVLLLADPDRTAGEAERVAMEHASTVLAMEVSHLQNLDDSKARARSNLVLELVAGDEGPGTVNRAQGLGYDLGRPHRVVMLECRDDAENGDAFFHAVSRAVHIAQVGSLVAARLKDVIVLADREAPWERFQASVVAEMHGALSSVGVGGRCDEIAGFPRSYREAQLALRMQKAFGGSEQVTVFDDLGVYQVLATTTDISAMENFVTDWLGTLLSYDAVHGTRLVPTLGEYLDRGGSYDASASALSVHRSTLKYRLRRIREVSGHDLAVPNTQFNLQLATRAWRTMQALRQS